MSVTAGDIAFATELLALYSAAECRTFIDFSLSEASTTNFNVRSFVGVKQYQAAYSAKRHERARHSAADEARRKQAESDRLAQALSEEYEAFRNAQLERIRASLPAAAIANLEEQARTLLQHGPLKFKDGAGRLVRIAVNDQLAREHAVPSFDEWKAAGANGLA